jgi:thiol-disulfide isomerase/thioredoxin
MDVWRSVTSLLVICGILQFALAEGPQLRSESPKGPVAASGAEAAQPSGIGVAWKRSDGQFFVGRILPNTPAAHCSSLHVGDRLLAVAQANHEPIAVMGMPMEKVVSLIRGVKGSVVTLTVIPAGKSEADAVVVPLARGTVAVLDRFGDGQLLPIGTEAPNFKAISLQSGEEFQPKSARGKVLILEFSVSGCAPCLRQIAELEKLARANPSWKERVRLIVVAVDEEKQEAAKWTRQSGQPWRHTAPVWSGPATLKAYHVAALPTVYVLDRDGRVLAAGHSIDLEKAIQKAL